MEKYDIILQSQMAKKLKLSFISIMVEAEFSRFCSYFTNFFILKTFLNAAKGGIANLATNGIQVKGI